MRTSNDPAADDPRDARALSPAENADLCSGCVRCCSYLAIAIDAPRAAWEYDQWIWALHHDKVEIYVERPEAWFLHFEARCLRLDPRGRCSIHGRHPVLCREYDPRSCERRHPLSHLRAWFHNAEELETWLARERPAHWRRLQAWRRDAEPAGPSSAPDRVPTPPAWIPLEAVGAPGGIPGPGGASAAGVPPAEAALPVHEDL